MIVYRLGKWKWADSLDGIGSAIVGGRWNPIGVRALYTSQNTSLCLLEVLAHLRKVPIPDDYFLTYIYISPDAPIKEIRENQLKKNWKKDEIYTSLKGGEILSNDEIAGFKVPSAINKYEYNFVLNPLYKYFRNDIGLIDIHPLEIDQRLLKNLGVIH